MKSEPKTDKAVTGEQGPEVTKVMEEAPVSSNTLIDSRVIHSLIVFRKVI